MSDSAARTIWARPFLRGASIALFVSGIGVGATMPQMTLYLVDELHASLPVAGLYSLVNVMAPIAGFVLGSLSDRLPERLGLFRVTALVSATGFVGLALATQLWMPFVIGALALGVGGGSMGLLFAAVRDELSRHPTHVDNQVISGIRMAFSAGWILGPVLGSWFGAAFGLRELFWATAALSALQLVPLGRARVPRFVVQDGGGSAHEPGRGRGSLAPLLIFLVGCLLLMAGDTMKFSYLPLYMDNQLHTSDAMRGTVISIQPLLELALMPVFARLADRVGAIWVLAAGSAFGIAAHLSYAFSDGVAGLFVGQTFMSVVWAVIAGLGISVAQELAPRRVGLASSLFSSAIPLSGAFGGLVGAFGVLWLGLPRVFLVPAALAAVGVSVIVLVGRRFARPLR